MNRYPMAPPITKAIIYKDSDTRASWAPHSLDAWLLGPSKDHYRCHLYYVPEMRGYRVSGSANLFPQHCMAPTYTPESHAQELSNELQHNLVALSHKQHNMRVIKSLAPCTPPGCVYHRYSNPSPRTDGRRKGGDSRATKGDGHHTHHNSPHNSMGEKHPSCADSKQSNSNMHPTNKNAHTTAPHML